MFDVDPRSLQAAFEKPAVLLFVLTRHAADPAAKRVLSYLLVGSSALLSEPAHAKHLGSSF